MEKRIIQSYTIVFYLTALFSLFSCKKDSSDYTRKYLGSWNFNSEKTENSNSGSGPMSYITNYQGKIYGTDQKNELLILFTNYDNLKLYVNKDGELFTDAAQKTKIGYFNKYHNKVNITYIDSENPGVTTTTTINGKKSWR